jgi:hypothetical protein
MIKGKLVWVAVAVIIAISVGAFMMMRKAPYEITPIPLHYNERDGVLPPLNDGR